MFALSIVTWVAFLAVTVGVCSEHSKSNSSRTNPLKFLKHNQSDSGSDQILKPLPQHFEDSTVITLPNHPRDHEAVETQIPGGSMSSSGTVNIASVDLDSGQNQYLHPENDRIIVQKDHKVGEDLNEPSETAVIKKFLMSCNLEESSQDPEICSLMVSSRREAIQLKIETETLKEKIETLNEQEIHEFFSKIHSCISKAQIRSIRVWVTPALKNSFFAVQTILPYWISKLSREKKSKYESLVKNVMENISKLEEFKSHNDDLESFIESFKSVLSLIPEKPDLRLSLGQFMFSNILENIFGLVYGYDLNMEDPVLIREFPKCPRHTGIYFKFRSLRRGLVFCQLAEICLSVSIDSEDTNAKVRELTKVYSSLIVNDDSGIKHFEFTHAFHKTALYDSCCQVALEFEKIFDPQRIQ